VPEHPEHSYITVWCSVKADFSGLEGGSGLQWLEALGFCGVGESGPFVAAGSTRADGIGQVWQVRHPPEPLDAQTARAWASNGHTGRDQLVVSPGIFLPHSGVPRTGMNFVPSS
jgi:hypothetical protein